MEELEKKLLKTGLSEKAIAVYLAILAIGKGNVSAIARKSGLKRTSLYQYLEELLGRDFLYQTVKGKRVEYAAASPKKLLSSFEKEKRELDRKRASVEAVIPELEALYSKSFRKPQVTFYEGKERILEAYREMVDTNQDVYTMFSLDHFFTVFTKEENHELLIQLKASGVTLYDLIERPEVETDRRWMKKYESFVKQKVLPEELRFESDLLVTGDRLFLVSFENLVAVIITDRAIADMQRRFLKFIWKNV
ncbi:MAG TPA: helix-turn-helix domain-containing protein [Candidatus Fimivivens sp.]|nr:helix-turn-helix domain-containing protein [Candidatus Fimivivens sp.]